MKLMSTTNDAIGVDTRIRDSSRPVDNNSSNDDKSPPFDGVLADVRSGDRSAAAKAADAKAADARSTDPRSTDPRSTDSKTADGKAADGKTADAKSVDTKSLDAKTPIASKIDGATAASTIAAGADVGATGPTIIDTLLGLLAKGPSAVTGSAAGKDDSNANPSTGADAAGGLVGALLKKIKDGAVAATAAGPAAPSAVPTDMMSMLLLGSGIKATTPGAQADGSSSARTGAGAVANLAASADAAGPTDAKETIVSNLAVATHLAPADTRQGKALPSDPKAAATPTVFDGTAPANPAAHIDDAIAAPVHGTEASGPAPDLASLGQSFGPVRSVATALGELAAQTAPAAVTPETAKPAALGVARTMTLQLNPADLGTVAIRMHITGQTLDVELTISDPRTLGMVSRERDTLSSALHDQNYQLNSLVIQDGGASASSGGNNAATQGDTPSGNARPDRQGGGAGAGSDTPADSRQGQSADRSTRDDRQPGRDSTPRPAADPRGRSLFV